MSRLSGDEVIIEDLKALLKAYRSVSGYTTRSLQHSINQLKASITNEGDIDIQELYKNRVKELTEVLNVIENDY